jgi:cell wall-associated NlpC family hydrolase
MQQITNQLRIVLFAVARWFVTRGAWRLLAAGAGYVYRHRVQIVQYKYTLSILMALSVAWAGWRLYAHVQGPAAGDAVVYEAEIAAEAEEPTGHYAVLASDTSEGKRSTALITSVYGWLGTPHCDGGTSKRGTDCSNFVQRVYQEAYGIALNRNSRAMYEEDVEAIRKEDLREGDLVFFDINGDGISHVGIYLRNHMFAHASSSRGVIVESLESPYYRKNYAAAGRVRN